MGFLDLSDKLEPKYHDVYNVWKQAPSKHNTSVVLKTIKPEIDKGISAHVGQTNPLIQSRARKLAINALRNYDPARARLGTHVINQLQGLKRVHRQQVQILPIPERVSIDHRHLERARTELSDELGREPSTEEISDRTGLSTRRIRHIRKFKYPISEGMLSDVRGDDDESGGFMPAVEQDVRDAWIEFVYSDMDPVNKKIMEWTLGLHGEPPLTNRQISAKLGLTPGAISQRKAAIQRVLDQEELSPF